MKLRHWYTVFGTIDAPLDAASLCAALRPPVDGLLISNFDQPLQGAEITALVRAPAKHLAPSAATSTGRWRHGFFWSHDKPNGALIAQIHRVQHPDVEFTARMEVLREFLAQSPDDECRKRVTDTIGRTNLIVNLSPFSGFSSIGDAKLARICEQICGHVCRATEGIIQVYQEGFFSAEGESLLPRNSKHRLKTR